MHDIINEFIEIKLPDEDSFLVIKETLTRIGISSKKEKKLWQSVHLLHKKGKYYLVHYKQMFQLDGRSSTFDESDRARLNTIACLMEEWGLCKIIDGSEKLVPKTNLSRIKIIRFSDKKDWQLIPKYSIGNN